MLRGATARLFAAVDPPPETAETLSAWGRTAAVAGRDRSLRVLAAESLHVTLMFLGERPVEEIDELAEAIATAAARAQPCEIETAAPVWLPPRRPRALAIELQEHSGALGDLQRDTARLLCAVSGLPEPRRFRPHVTVARTRSGETTAGAQMPATPRLTFTVGEVILYRSRLDPAGARYEALASSVLSGAG
jgi:RNA 2',3'-cyclic 3'-phosphodiesterase